MTIVPLSLSPVSSPVASTVSSPATNPAIGPVATPKNKGLNFDKVKASFETQTKDSGNDLMVMQSRIESGKAFSQQELLMYQIKVNQFHLRVELVSKVAEGAVATVKRFQNGQ